MKCTQSPTSDSTSEMFEESSMAEVDLKAILRDSDSARFRNVMAYVIQKPALHPDQWKVDYVYCGEINAKNGLGGYAGWERFLVEPTIDKTAAYIDDPGFSDDPSWTKTFQFFWASFCTGQGTPLSW